MLPPRAAISPISQYIVLRVSPPPWLLHWLLGRWAKLRHVCDVSSWLFRRRRNRGPRRTHGRGPGPCSRSRHRGPQWAGSLPRPASVNGRSTGCRTGRGNSSSARLKTGAIVAVVVNGFGNETRRYCRDGVRRGVMVRTDDQSRPARLTLARRRETATGRLITRGRNFACTAVSTVRRPTRRVRAARHDAAVPDRCSARCRG